jgi:hypothetical protein
MSFIDENRDKLSRWSGLDFNLITGDLYQWMLTAVESRSFSLFGVVMFPVFDLVNHEIEEKLSLSHVFSPDSLYPELEKREAFFT